MITTKIRDGFEGQKLISLPSGVYKNTKVLSQIYITHIGYFPKASFHFRERKNGCEDNIFIYCLHGKGWYEIDKKRYEVKPGQFFQIPATNKHLKYGADQALPWTIFWVHYSGKNMDDFNQTLNISLYDGPKNIPYNEKGLQIWNEIYSCLEMGYSKDNLNNANMCLYYFLTTFQYIEKHFPLVEDKDMIRETIVFMKEKIESRFKVEHFAERYKLSVSHFSSMFHHATGTSPMEYFIQLKIQKSCQLLYTTNITIKDIALSLGYDDPYYFSRLFKKMMELSPEQYRQLKNNDI